LKYLMWLFKAALFFTLFAFSLNNQQVVSVNFFFGTLWQAPLVLVVLVAFAAGLALGVLMMVPRWWRSRKHARLAKASIQPAAEANAAPSALGATQAAQAPHGI
jgi:lipopolysaccharide assembly protein A